MPCLTELTEQLLSHVKSLENYTTAKGLPSPSFEETTYSDLPAQAQASRNAAIDLAQTIRKLAMGPEACATEILHGPVDLTSLRVIYLYNIPQAVPINGSATYRAISKACHLSQSMTYRFLRHAMANRIFYESSPGHVSHTAISRMMAEDPDFVDTISMYSDELVPALMKVPEVLARFPDSGEPEETAYSISNDTKLSFHQFLQDKPERSRRFGQSMKFMTKGSAFNISHLTTTYDWAALDRPGSTLVDVGGGHGSVVQHLADHTTNMRFIVQDLPETTLRGQENLPAKYKSRIDFASHDFYTDQTIKGKDIYFFRWIFHNHSDPYCVKILKGLIPAMKTGAKVLVYEMVLPESPQTSLTQKLSFGEDKC